MIANNKPDQSFALKWNIYSLSLSSVLISKLCSDDFSTDFIDLNLTLKCGYHWLQGYIFLLGCSFKLLGGTVIDKNTTNF